MSKGSYNRLGDHINEVNVRNTEQKAEKLLGINIDKFFMPSVANIVGTDLSVYRLVRKNQFACNRMHVGRDYRLPISMSKTDEEFMVSPAYDVFEIKDTDILYPEYLMMWFTRREFDRNAWFYTDADVRGGLHWDALCDMKLPIPSITKQKEIVKEYNVIQDRIALNQEMIQKLEETAQAIYKQWFVDFEFPCLPLDYRPAGQVNLPIDFYSVLTYKRVGGVPVPDGSWFVYVILCEDDSFYKGMTNDLYLRFYEHYTGIGADWTKVHKPVKVIHWEQFSTQEEAAKRENDLKTGYGRTWLQRQYEKAVNGGSPACLRKMCRQALKTECSPARECQLRMAGEMVESELGMIPKGWEANELQKIILLKNGKSKPAIKGKYPVYGGNGILEYVDKSNEENVIVIGRVGAYCGSLFRVLGKCWISDNAISAQSKIKANMYSYYVLNNLNLNERSEGTGQPLITQGLLNGIRIIIPTDKLICDFEKISSCIFKNHEMKSQETLKLEELKSLLLSKLATVKD